MKEVDKRRILKRAAERQKAWTDYSEPLRQARAAELEAKKPKKSTPKGKTPKRNPSPADVAKEPNDGQ